MLVSYHRTDIRRLHTTRQGSHLGRDCQFLKTGLNIINIYTLPTRPRRVIERKCRTNYMKAVQRINIVGLHYIHSSASSNNWEWFGKLLFGEGTRGHEGRGRDLVRGPEVEWQSRGKFFTIFYIDTKWRKFMRSSEGSQISGC